MATVMLSYPNLAEEARLERVNVSVRIRPRVPNNIMDCQVWVNQADCKSVPLTGLGVRLAHNPPNYR